MINSDKLLKFKSLFEQIILLAKDVESQYDHQLPEKIFTLLDMLVHMQSLNISIRTELIEKLIFTRPDLSRQIKNQHKKAADIIVLFDHRKVNSDRRNSHTFLTNKRRSGIADRRRSTQKIDAEIRSRR